MLWRSGGDHELIYGTELSIARQYWFSFRFCTSPGIYGRSHDRDGARVTRAVEDEIQWRWPRLEDNRILLYAGCDDRIRIGFRCGDMTEIWLQDEPRQTAGSGRASDAIYDE